MTNSLETDILALLEPGGMLTADTIARNLNTPKWRVVRALHTLRDNRTAFQNTQAQWQIAASKSRPLRQATR